MDGNIKVTKELSLRAVLFGACKMPQIGRKIKDFSSADLCWAERILSQKEKNKFDRPLWTYSSSGSGDGDGYSSGSGYGDGSGDGSGSGYGYGYGYGYSYGYGDGDGSGYGYGYGSG